jgi:hypothetical protein
MIGSPVRLLDDSRKKGAIQVDSPPFFLAQPVGGKPGLVALMFLSEPWFRKKVAGAVEIANAMRGLS